MLSFIPFLLPLISPLGQCFTSTGESEREERESGRRGGGVSQLVVPQSAVSLHVTLNQGGCVGWWANRHI